MYYLFTESDLIKLQRALNAVSEYITYLDTMSIGKTKDFDDALSSLARFNMDAKKICNYAKKIFR